MTKRPQNEFTPRERGLLMGNKYAELYDGDPFDLKPVADGDIDDDLREKVSAFLVESDDIENPTQFWEGFSHGVAAFLVDQGITARSGH